MYTVQVLMSTYNGELYLKDQIDSILSQKGVNVKITVRDDGSTDNTIKILRDYYYAGKINLIEGKNIGYKRSFIWLLDNSDEGDFYAFSDQDDVWNEDKLISAVEELKRIDIEQPAMYSSALTSVDCNLKYLRKQDFPKLRNNFYSEIVRHRFAGCTYVFNNELRKKCVGVSKINEYNYGHDGYVSLVCWICNGIVIYDEKSHILFRRHGNNTSSDGAGLTKRIKNEFSFFNKKKNVKSQTLKIITNNINCSNSRFINDIDMIIKSKSSFVKRMKLLFNKKYNCGLILGNLSFRLSVLFNCI